MFAFISRDSNRKLTGRAWTRVFALAFGGFCIASTHGDSPRVRTGDDIMTDDMGFFGRCIDWEGRIHLAAADPTQRFGVGPARPSVEETPWHAQVVRDGHIPVDRALLEILTALPAASE